MAVVHCQAIDLTGLFVGKGPVVQQLDAGGKVIQVMIFPRLPDGSVGVLINRGSASASRFCRSDTGLRSRCDCRRANFGKGTVQTVVNLDQGGPQQQTEFGELKLTVAQFFRVNGGTTQLRSVTPDITLPGPTPELR